LSGYFVSLYTAFEVAKQNRGKFLNLDQNFKAKPSADFAQLQILRPNLVLLMQDSIFIYLHTILPCLTLVIHFVSFLSIVSKCSDLF